MLNDITALEAARHLAEQGWGPDRSSNAQARLNTMFQRVLSRLPLQEELTILRREHDKAMSYYAQNRDAAKELITVGQLPKPVGIPVETLAADMLTASLILNLDESITHE